MKYVGKVESTAGYINFYVDSATLVKETLEKILIEKSDYGTLGSKGHVIVEHTSANPIHPLHIGHLRNAVIGDAVAKILKKSGVQSTMSVLCKWYGLPGRAPIL